MFNGSMCALACHSLLWESPAYILNEDTQLVIRAIGVSHTACKDEFRRNLRSHSWSVFSFFIIYSHDSYARSEYHTQLAKMNFDKIFDLTAGVYFYFHDILSTRNNTRDRSITHSLQR